MISNTYVWPHATVANYHKYAMGVGVKFTWAKSTYSRSTQHSSGGHKGVGPEAADEEEAVNASLYGLNIYRAQGMGLSAAAVVPCPIYHNKGGLLEKTRRVTAACCYHSGYVVSSSWHLP